ncbi:uncharacterized protein HaLaN_16440, partial [Haematococcus lacustris]
MATVTARAPQARPKARFGRAHSPDALEQLYSSQNDQLAAGDGAVEEGPVAHLLPKVMVPYITPPGETPRKVNRMLGYALNSKRLKDRLMDTSQLIGEVNVDYTRTMNKMSFDAALRRGHSGCAAPLVALTEQFQQEEQKPAPLKGCVSVAEYDYPHQFSEYSFRTLLTKPEVISALARIRVECAKVLKMSLFNLHYTKSLRLDEFEQGQSQNTDQ